MKLFHLSHIDLDGYGCQAVSTLYFPDAKLYNSNYGAEIFVRLSQMANEIENKTEHDDHVLVLITDLNLSQTECEWIENECETLRGRGRNIELILLDHHISGQPQSEKFSWYTLDNFKSATKLTYDFFLDRYGSCAQAPANFGRLVEAINAVDLWHENDSAFEFGKTLMRLASDSKEINKTMFGYENAAYRTHLLRSATRFLDQEKSHIALDDNIHFLKKEFLRSGGENDTLDNLTSRYVLSLLAKKRVEFTVHYKEYKALLTVGVGNVSVIANAFLSANEEFDFYIDVSGRGNVSMRSNNKADVSLIAKELLGGGGHKNASGGKMQNGREIFVYDDCKRAVESLIHSKLEKGG